MADLALRQSRPGAAAALLAAAVAVRGGPDLSNLDAARVETRGLALRRPSLDDVFLGLTGHAAEEEEPGGRRRGRRAARRGKDMERTAS